MFNVQRGQGGEFFLVIEKKIIYQKCHFLDLELQQMIIGLQISYVPKYNLRGPQKSGSCWSNSKWDNNGEFFRDLTKPKNHFIKKFCSRVAKNDNWAKH